VTPWHSAERAKPEPARSSARSFAAATLLLVSIPSVAFLFLFASLLLPLPTHASNALAGFLIAANAVLAVSFTAAPPQRAKYAAAMAVLSIAVEAFIARWYRLEPLVTLAAPAVGVAAVALLLAVPRIRRAAVALLALYPVLLIATFMDWPSLPDPLPRELAGSPVKSFHSYPLSSFIDRESLWRIDAAPEALETIAQELRMTPSNTAPDAFWRMPPWYWPRHLPAGARFYSTPSFPAEARGPDGAHFLMLVDTHRSRAFVWFKNNF
jgi:hypothetical protein